MGELESNPARRIALFQRQEVRRVIHNHEWWFVILDVIAALTDSVNAKGYFTDMRRREAATTEIARNRDAQGFPQNQQAAHSGGKVAGNARCELEKKSGRKVVTSENDSVPAQSVKKVKPVK